MAKNQIKIHWTDRLAGFFSPTAQRNRMIARQQTALLTRQYEAAQSFNSSQISRNSRSANRELRPAIALVRENVREIVRNTPFAQKGLQVIVNGTVGWGIEASITHQDKAKEQKIKELWADWSGGLCSVDGKTDFNTMQAQVMTAIVSDGEALLREVILEDSVRLQLLEADYIDTKQDGNFKDKRTINGIVVDKYQRPTSFYLFDEHPGEIASASREVPASEVIHCFKQDRPGQLRGISWFAPVAHPMKMLSELQWTQLVRLKLSAAITGVVTREPSQLSPDQQAAQDAADFELSPGTFKTLNPGESIEFPSIPNPEGFDGTTKLVLREIAAGLGVTYEALSGDLSQVNFSSGRMGNLQFKANIESWRWQLLVPRFLNPAFQRFQKYCALKGVDASQAKVTWTPPAAAMISPVDEVSATQNAIRAGLQTLPGALRELGINPEQHMKEIAESNQKLDELGIILDSDPRHIGNQMRQQKPTGQPTGQ